jgi:hypothetical protein
MVNQVYGLFWATGDFLSKNYVGEFFGVGTGCTQVSVSKNGIAEVSVSKNGIAPILLDTFPADHAGQHLFAKHSLFWDVSR